MQSGLILLQKQFNLMNYQPNYKNQKQNIPIPIYSFITQLISSFKEYLNSNFRYCWAQYIICHKKHQTVQLIKSWIIYLRQSLQAQLLNSLLITNDIKKCKFFMRLRKYIMQLANINMLDEIALKHQDVITIVHRLFPATIKKQIMNGIKQIFISYKVAQAKIYACVFIQYILSIYDSIDENQQSFMVGETKITNSILSNFSTINKFNSNLHKDNGLFRKVQTNENSYTIIETKFIPQELEKQKTKFEQQPYDHQYYSNSLNFSGQNFKQQKNDEKQNCKQAINSKNILRIKSNKTYENNSNNKQSEIRIQQQNSIKQYINENSNISNKSIKKQIQQVILRNKQFKNKLLTGKSSLKYQLSHQQEDSINDTINIIHSSIVRNRREII